MRERLPESLKRPIIDTEKTRTVRASLKANCLNTVCEKISVQTPTSFLASDKEYKSQNAIWTNFENGYYGESYKILCLSMDHDFIESIANKYNLEFQNYLNRGWHRLGQGSPRRRFPRRGRLPEARRSRRSGVRRGISRRRRAQATSSTCRRFRRRGSWIARS